jgi:hypothetical protein
VDSDISNREVRDPIRVEAFLDANFAELDNRTDGTTAVDLKTDDIEASGAAADSLGINHTRASATGLYSTVSLGETAVLLNDTDYSVTELLTFNNDATQAVVGGAIHVVVDDNTDTTEDSSLEVYSYINGSATKVIDVGATTMAVPLIGDFNSLTTDAGSGLDNAAGGTLPLGAVNATKVEIADTGVETEVQGDLDVLGNSIASDATIGAVVAAAGTVVEHGNSAYHKTIITVTNVTIALADGDDGEGIKIYDFDEGVVAVHGVLVDLVATNSGNFNASTDDLYYFAVGTVEATDADNDLTGTEANLIAKQTLDTAGGTDVDHDVETFLDTPDSIDGSSTALDIWLNASVEATDNSDANNIGVTGTLTILWSPLGDY